MSLMITVADGRSTFVPGEQINGHVTWQLDQMTTWTELRLFWYTQGKGTQDVGVVARERFEHPATTATIPFSFTAPTHPPSCSGRLVSICWALELVSSDDQQVPRVDLVIAPGGQEIRLGHVE